MSGKPQIVDSFVVSSTIQLPLKPVEPKEPRAIQLPLKSQTALTQRGPNALALNKEWSPERVANMYKRRAILPSAFWDSVSHVVFIAFVRAPMIELALLLQKEFFPLPAFTAWRELADHHIEIKLSMIQLLRIVGLAKVKRILQ